MIADTFERCWPLVGSKREIKLCLDVSIYTYIHVHMLISIIHIVIYANTICIREKR